MKALIHLYRVIFARPVFYKFNKALFLLSARGLGVLNFENDIASGERHLITAVLRKHLRTDSPVMVDVGANVGSYCRLLLQHFPTARIHAFEPHPKTFERLSDNFAQEAISLHNLALGDSVGVVALHDSDGDGTQQASLYKDVISELHRQSSTSWAVQLDTLDRFAEREQIEFIDFLKIDTEGNEFAVLKGAEVLLRNGRIGCIHFEFNEMNVVSRVFFRDFRKILVNYDLFRMLPHGIIRIGNNPLQSELFAYQNIFAVSRGANT